MLAFLRGTVLAKLPDSLVVELHDTGYRVHVPATMWERLHAGEHVELFTHEVVRDDRRELFGLPTLDTLRLFHQLITVSGVGPRVALGVVSLGAPQEIRDAIARGDVAYLSKVVGVGKKTAERVVVELRTKMEAGAGLMEGDVEHRGADDDILDALVQLGYKLQEVRDAVRKLPTAARTTEERLKAALQVLGKR